MAGAQSNVTIRMSADEARAVQGFRNLINSQRRVERQQRSVSRSTRQMNRNMGSALATVRRFAGGMLSIAGAGGVARSFIREMEEGARRVRDFDQAMQPLVGIGDHAARMDEMRESVRALSGEWGLSSADAAQFLAIHADHTSNLAEGLRRELIPATMRFTQLVGGEAPANLNMLNRILQNYGDEIGSAAQATDMLKMTLDAGTMDLSTFQSNFLDTIPIARALGVEFRELLAVIGAASAEGARDPRFMRGVRTLLTDLEQGVQAGEIQSTGLLNRLQEIAGMDADLSETFGRESVAIAETLTRNMDGLVQNFRELESATGLEVQGLNMRRLADETARAIQNLEAAERRVEDARTRDPRGVRFQHHAALGEELLLQGMPEWLGPFRERIARMGGVGSAMLGGIHGEPGPLAQMGGALEAGRRMGRGDMPGAGALAADLGLIGQRVDAGGRAQLRDEGRHVEAMVGQRRFGPEEGSAFMGAGAEATDRQAIQIQEQQLEAQREALELQRETYMLWRQAVMDRRGGGGRMTIGGQTSELPSRRNRHEE